MLRVVQSAVKPRLVSLFMVKVCSSAVSAVVMWSIGHLLMVFHQGWTKAAERVTLLTPSPCTLAIDSSSHADYRSIFALTSSAYTRAG